MRQFIHAWKERVQELKIQIYALYLAYHDPRVPWFARVVVAIVVGYALSPIDLIPDFIPVLGYLDDLVIVPIGITLALKLIPAEVMAECRTQARREIGSGKPVNKIAAILIVAIWLALAVVLILFFIQLAQSAASPQG